MFSIMKEELTKLIDWFRANKLSLNLSKTNYVFFRPGKIKLHDETIDSEYELKFGDEVILGKSCFEFLGIKIDEKLNWEEHIESVRKKLSSSLYMLNSVKTLIPFSCRKSLYYSFFATHIYPGLILWAPSILKREKKCYTNTTE